MFENNVILSEMPNMLNGYFGKAQESTEPNVVSLAFELALEEEMAAMLIKPLEVSTK
jgi:hypothetical protein